MSNLVEARMNCSQASSCVHGYPLALVKLAPVREEVK